MIPGLLQCFVREQNPRRRMKFIGPLVNCASAAIKYSILLFHESKIKYCIDHMEMDWKKAISNKDHDVVVAKAKVARKLVIFSMVFMYGGGVSYRTIVPLSKGVIVTPQNTTVRAFSCPAYFIFFDEQKTPFYELVFTGQFIAGFAVYSVTCGACGLAALLVMHICAQLKLSRLKMCNLADRENLKSDTVNNKIIDLVEHDVRVRRFLKIVESLLQYICLIEIIACIFLLCLCLYCIVLEWESSDATAMLTMGVLMTSFGFCIFIFCYIGQLLNDQGNKVGAAACAIDWHELPMKKPTDLLLIIMISNQQVSITAGKLIEMSLSSFGNIIKTSFAYFNILRRMISIAKYITTIFFCFFHTSDQTARYDVDTNHAGFKKKRWQPFQRVKLKILKIDAEIMLQSNSRPFTMDTTKLYKRNYKNDYNFSIELNRWVMKSIAVWPKSPESSILQRFLWRFVNFACYSLIIFLMIPCGLFMILEINDTYHKIQLTGPLSFCLMAIIKYYSLILRENEIRDLLKRIEIDWESVKFDNDRRLMLRSAEFGRRLMAICGFFMYGGAVFYYLAMPFAIGKVTADDGNFTYRPLVYPVSKILVDARQSPINEIFFILQCLSGFIAHSITVASCSLAAVFAMHVCGQLDVLMAWLNRLVQSYNEFESVDEIFAEVINQHVRTLGFIARMEYILREISLVEVVGCTLNLCFLCYYCMKEYSDNQNVGTITYVTLLISLTFNIFIFCYIGELVAGQCKKIGDMAYMIDWYQLPKKSGLNLILMIAMSNSNTKLTAGNLINLSLGSFGDIIKTSVAYLNMLRQLTA
ncbi:uncharacterized protein [Prorops nasuta]|uniref:uncharacterized protein n=1 Tax=Prorops nasuta TaxID=863751 RepID=UPI0034CE5959